VENGCKWRDLPKEYGDWHIIYVQVNERCVASGVFTTATNRYDPNKMGWNQSGFHLHPGSPGWTEGLKKMVSSPLVKSEVDGTPNFLRSLYRIRME